MCACSAARPAPVLAEANVDGEEDGGDDDADARDDAQDDVQGQVDALQVALLQRAVPRRARA